MKGFMQVCVTHAREPLRALRQLGVARFFGAVVLTFGTVLAALGYPICIALSVVGLWDGTLLTAAGWIEAGPASIALTLFTAGWIAMIGPAVAALRRRQWLQLLPYVAALPAYYVLVSAAAWRGLAELILNPSHWSKTEHGLAQTSRMALTSRAAGRGPPPRADG